MFKYGIKEMPVYSVANITKSLDCTQLVQVVAVANVLFSEKGQIVLLLRLNHIDKNIPDVEEAIQRKFAAIDDWNEESEETGSTPGREGA